GPRRARPAAGRAARILPVSGLPGRDHIQAGRRAGADAAAPPILTLAPPRRPCMARKFVIASMLHETNTFSPLPTPIGSFGPGGPLRGEQAIAELADTNYGIGG